MSKAVLVSIRPEWCEKIASGEKTIEVRKTCPKLPTPFKCYIYCTLDKNESFICRGDDDMPFDVGNGMVIGEFVCDRIERFDVPYPAYQKELDKRILEQSCLTYYQLHRYAYHDDLYGWNISELKIYDTPKELSEFEGLQKTRFGYAPYKITRPPQSWCYVEELT